MIMIMLNAIHLVYGGKKISPLSSNYFNQISELNVLIYTKGRKL